MGETRNVHRILNWKAGRDDQLGAKAFMEV